MTESEAKLIDIAVPCSISETVYPVYQKSSMLLIVQC